MNKMVKKAVTEMHYESRLIYQFSLACSFLNPKNYKYNYYQVFCYIEQSKNHNSIFTAKNKSCETCNILFVKNEQLQNRSKCNFSKKH